VPLSLKFPTLIEDPSAAEGEASHWAMYSLLKTHEPKPGDMAPNGILLDDELIDMAQVYVNHVASIVDPQSAWGLLNVERRMSLTMLHPEMFGTPDSDVWLPRVFELHLFDLKTGHLKVDPYECWQVVAYARGALERLNLSEEDLARVKIFIHICQPRAFHFEGPIRTWQTTVARLRPLWATITERTTLALGPDAEKHYHTGPECEFCPGRRACTVLAQEAATAMDQAQQSLPVDLPPQAVGLELRWLDQKLALLEARRSGLAEQATYYEQRGQSVPFYGMRAGAGRRKWKPDVKPQEFRSLGALLGGVDLMAEQKPLTPPQAEEKLKKLRIDPAVIASYYEHVPGAMKLVPVDTNHAKKVFTP